MYGDIQLFFTFFKTNNMNFIKNINLNHLRSKSNLQIFTYLLSADQAHSFQYDCWPPVLQNQGPEYIDASGVSATCQKNSTETLA